jgi:4a-hydroxytetrahydrobiopterin dehydratase
VRLEKERSGKSEPGRMELSFLANKRCVPYDRNTPPMSREDAKKYLKEIPGWALSGDSITKEFKFRSYLRGLKFAYSLGKIAERQNHHPDILIRWRKVRVTLTTHDINGLSENDFIMAARAEKILKESV